jgi:2-polyprenyl-6-methoxyphenol hydroxylase-like FAD-dependent oxidoreductase
MLLARLGHKVLVVDRATFPSDTISTHVVHPPGVAALRRWGILDRLTATGCPPIDTYAFDFGFFTIAGAPGTPESPVAYCPRRTVLDKLLVDAAAEAGAEVREQFTVEDVVVEDGRIVGVRGHGKGGESVTERARVVVGADGRYSKVAQTVAAEAYNERPQVLSGYYSYFSGLPMNGRFEVYVRDMRGFAAAPTNDDSPSSSAAGRSPNTRRTSPTSKATGSRSSTRHRSSPNGFAARPVRAALRARQSPTTSASRSGRGGRSWAMPATTRTSSPRKASPTRSATPSCVRTACTHPCPARGRSMKRWANISPLVTSTFCRCSSSQPPPPELQQVLGAVHGNQDAMDGFARVNAGVTSPAEFFSEENIGRIFAAAG